MASCLTYQHFTEGNFRNAFINMEMEETVRQELHELLSRMLPEQAIQSLIKNAERNMKFQAVAELYSEVSVLFISVNVQEAGLDGSRMVSIPNALALAPCTFALPCAACMAGLSRAGSLTQRLLGVSLRI